jgi:hypothetical protein
LPINLDPVIFQCLDLENRIIFIAARRSQFAGRGRKRQEEIALSRKMLTHLGQTGYLVFLGEQIHKAIVLKDDEIELLPEPERAHITLNQADPPLDVSIFSGNPLRADIEHLPAQIQPHDLISVACQVDEESTGPATEFQNALAPGKVLKQLEKGIPQVSGFPTGLIEEKVRWKAAPPAPV